MNKTATLSLLVAVQLMVILDSTVVNVALPAVRTDLGFSTANLSWVLNAYALAFGGLLLLGGRAGDLLGRRRVLLGGLAVFTLASALGGAAQTPGQLIAARVLQGIGGAVAAPSVLAIITATFEEGAPRNKALGVFSAASAGGASLGLLLGGALTAIASWRWVMWINVPVGIAVLTLGPRILVETARQPAKLDLPGTLTSTSGASLLVYAFIRASEAGWADTVAILAFAVSAALLTAFVVIESRTRQPLIPLSLLKDSTRGPAFLAMGLIPAAMLGMFFLMTQFLQDSLGYSAMKTGLAFLPLTALIFTLSQIVPRLLPKHGPRPFMVGGGTLLLVALVWLSRLDASASYFPGVFGPMLLFGTGAGLLFMPLSAVILGGVPRDQAGAAAGVLQVAQQAGGALGVAVLVSVLEAHGLSGALEAAAAIMVVALALIVVPVSGFGRTGASQPVTQ